MANRPVKSFASLDGFPRTTTTSQSKVHVPETTLQATTLASAFSLDFGLAILMTMSDRNRKDIYSLLQYITDKETEVRNTLAFVCTTYCHDLEIPGHFIFFNYINQILLPVLTSTQSSNRIVLHHSH